VHALVGERARVHEDRRGDACVQRQRQRVTAQCEATELERARGVGRCLVEEGVALEQ